MYKKFGTEESGMNYDDIIHELAAGDPATGWDELQDAAMKRSQQLYEHVQDEQTRYFQSDIIERSSGPLDIGDLEEGVVEQHAYKTIHEQVRNADSPSNLAAYLDRYRQGMQEQEQDQHEGPSSAAVYRDAVETVFGSILDE